MFTQIDMGKMITIRRSYIIVVCLSLYNAVQMNMFCGIVHNVNNCMHEKKFAILYRLSVSLKDLIWQMKLRTEAVVLKAVFK